MQKIRKMQAAGGGRALRRDSDFEFEEKRGSDHQPQQKSISITAQFQSFVQNCRENLRVVLVVSPLNKRLKGWLRNYPSLVSCCTVNWYEIWPDAALQQTGQQYFQNQSLNRQLEARLSEEVIRIGIEYHNYFAARCEQVWAERKRAIYLTPMHFVGFIDLVNRFLVKF